MINIFNFVFDFVDDNIMLLRMTVIAIIFMRKKLPRKSISVKMRIYIII